MHSLIGQEVVVVHTLRRQGSKRVVECLGCAIQDKHAVKHGASVRLSDGRAHGAEVPVEDGFPVIVCAGGSLGQRLESA